MIGPLFWALAHPQDLIVGGKLKCPKCGALFGPDERKVWLVHARHCLAGDV